MALIEDIGFDASCRSQGDSIVTVASDCLHSISESYGLDECYVTGEGVALSLISSSRGDCCPVGCLQGDLNNLSKIDAII